MSLSEGLRALLGTHSSLLPGAGACLLCADRAALQAPLGFIPPAMQSVASVWPGTAPCWAVGLGRHLHPLGALASQPGWSRVGPVSAPRFALGPGDQVTDLWEFCIRAAHQASRGWSAGHLCQDRPGPALP